MYGDYYPTGFYGAAPQMQERLAMLEQQRQIQRPTLSIHGHLVTGIEEAKAAQIMLDGTPSYFPSPAEGKIYEKSIDMNGMPVFKVYALSNEPKQEKSSETLEALAAKVAGLEKAVNEMKGGNTNEPISTNRNAETGTESPGDAATACRE